MPENQALFGHVAVDLGLISSSQLVDATRLQNNPDETRSLGQLLLGLGWITREQLRDALAEQNRRRGESLEDQLTSQQDEVAEPGPVEALPEEPFRPQPRPSAEFTSLQDILQQAVVLGASDIHIHSGSRVRIRHHGNLLPLTSDKLPTEAAGAMVREALDDEQWAELEGAGQVDFSLSMPDLARFRANAYRQQEGLDLILRVIPDQIRDLDQLGLGTELARFTTYHQGLVLITGPSGCGKTSTLAALVNIINQERNDHIVTAEDPIEYVHRSKRCVINQREVGTHSESFPRVLRAALREDPDVIVLGELRDLETVSLALTAAETGHLVLGTLHTAGAVQTIGRLLGLSPPEGQEQMRVMLAESLRAVISQRLVPRADGTGRVPAVEIMVVTRAISNLIRENKLFQIQSMLQTGRDKGMQMLSESMAELVSENLITQQEADRQL